MRVFCDLQGTVFIVLLVHLTCQWLCYLQISSFAPLELRRTSSATNTHKRKCLSNFLRRGTLRSLLALHSFSEGGGGGGLYLSAQQNIKFFSCGTANITSACSQIPWSQYIVRILLLKLHNACFCK